MKLLVRNLTRSLTDSEVSKLFAEHGTVQSCIIVKDENTKQSKGFGFVEMPDEKEAETAIKALNLTKVSTKVIRVKNADEKVD